MAYGKDAKTDEQKGQEIVKKADKAFKTPERTNVESMWQLLAEFIVPGANGGFFGSDGDKGARKDSRIFTNTAPQALRDLAAFFHATITNPAMQWSKLRFKQEILNNENAAVGWLQDAIEKVHMCLDESNFNSEIGEAYESLGGFGTTAIFHEELAGLDGEVKYNFCTWHLSEIAIAENSVGMVDTIYRKFKMTLKQLYEKFGNKIGEDLKTRMLMSPLEEYHLYHGIYPRDPKEVKLDKTTGLAMPKDRPFASCYVLCKGSKLLLEDGYYEFPVYVPRWATRPAEIYGYGPGHMAIPDTRSMNKVWEQGLKALAKSVNPVILTARNNIFSGAMVPGGTLAVRDINQIKEFITQSNMQALQFSMERLDASIKSAFYIDKLLLPPRTETGEMTAYEVAQRLEQLQQILGPVVSRFNDELLTPLILRSLKILQRSGQLKPFPIEVLEKFPDLLQSQGNSFIDFEILFVNALARSQQLSELRNVQTFLQEVGAMAQIKPEVLDNVDGDEVLYYMARIRNIPEQMLLSKEDVMAMRQQRQQQIEQQQALAQAESLSKSAGNVGVDVAQLMQQGGQGQQGGGGK